jgi:uncharacterized protein
MSERAPVEVTIESIRTSLMTQHRAVVLREKGGERVLPIWIGAFEADAIALALQGQQPQRPMTHDMALRLLEPLGARVRHVAISKILENTFFAEIALTAGEQAHVVDARPSDALALAARTGAPVLVAPAVMDAASTADKDELSSEMETGGVQPRAPVVMERLPAGSVIEGAPLSPDVLATLSYVYSFLDADTGLMGLRLANVRWDERFPARPLELEGRRLQAVRLHEGDEETWIAVTPQTWETVTRVARQVIAREQRLQAALRQESEADRAPGEEGA